MEQLWWMVTAQNTPLHGEADLNTTPELRSNVSAALRWSWGILVEFVKYMKKKTTHNCNIWWRTKQLGGKITLWLWRSDQSVSQSKLSEMVFGGVTSRLSFQTISFTEIMLQGLLATSLKKKKKKSYPCWKLVSSLSLHLHFLGSLNGKW